MVKAEIKKSDGTQIVIEGSEEEVKRLLGMLQGEKLRNFPKDKSAPESKSEKLSIIDMISELKYEGFFDQPKSLVEIKNGLAEKGHIYELNTLSTQVVRAVRRRAIGRIKKEKKWMYVKR